VSALKVERPDSYEGGIWPSLNRFLLTLIAVVIFTSVGYRMMPEIGRRKDQEAKIEVLTALITEQKQRLFRYQREEYLLKFDPDYIGLIARDRLDLMKEGETIYRLEPPRPDPSRFRRKD
jgi:cell division protein FtsB